MKPSSNLIIIMDDWLRPSERASAAHKLRQLQSRNETGFEGTFECCLLACRGNCNNFSSSQVANAIFSCDAMKTICLRTGGPHFSFFQLGFFFMTCISYVLLLLLLLSFPKLELQSSKVPIFKETISRLPSVVVVVVLLT